MQTSWLLAKRCCEDLNHGPPYFKSSTFENNSLTFPQQHLHDIIYRTAKNGSDNYVKFCLLSHESIFKLLLLHVVDGTLTECKVQLAN